jgi:hypothetical protein
MEPTQPVPGTDVQTPAPQPAPEPTQTPEEGKPTE